ncbi:uncharacterized protein LOC134813757 [Bolinopsis microptera]|uniref:uncharacterized protein LOC134813757 n=1 Tax=Bolinopsis microptera TaxID=2820187 RepID=UPI00307A0816
MIRPLLLIVLLLTFITKSSTELTSTSKTKVTTKPEPPAPKPDPSAPDMKPKPNPAAPTTNVKSKPETPAPAPPTEKEGDDHDLPRDHVQEENPHAEQTKNKPVAKPGRLHIYTLDETNTGVDIPMDITMDITLDINMIRKGNGYKVKCIKNTWEKQKGNTDEKECCGVKRNTYDDSNRDDNSDVNILKDFVKDVSVVLNT